MYTCLDELVTRGVCNTNYPEPVTVHLCLGFNVQRHIDLRSEFGSVSGTVKGRSITAFTYIMM